MSVRSTAQPEREQNGQVVQMPIDEDDKEEIKDGRGNVRMEKKKVIGPIDDDVPNR